MLAEFIGPSDGRQQATDPHLVTLFVHQMDGRTGDDVNCPPVPAFIIAYPGCWNDPLLSNPGPAAGDGGDQAHRCRIAKEQDQIGILLGLLAELTDVFFWP